MADSWSRFSRTDRLHFLLKVLLILGAGLWIYEPAYHGGFLWDDRALVADNLQLRSPGGLWEIWFAKPITDYWPLSFTVLWIEWHLFGDSTLGYHLINLGLHLSSGFLIWRIFRRLGARWGWIGGLLFVIHPLAVDSVAWMSEIKNTLSLPLFLLALDAWLKADQSGSKGWWWVSVLGYLVAMLAKTSVVMLPAVLLLHQWWRHGRITRRDCIRMIPYAGIALGLGWLTIAFQSGRSSSREAMAHSLWATSTCAGEIVFFYLRKFLLPWEVLPIYPAWPFDSPSPWQLASVPLLLALLACLWTQRRGGGRSVLLGFGFFLLNVLPILGFIGMAFMTISRVADHLVYLPMVGLAGLVMLGLEAISRQASVRLRPWCRAMVGLILILLAVESHQQAALYRDLKVLAIFTLEHNPNSAFARNYYGLVLSQEGRPNEAIAQFERALQVEPHNPALRANLGFALFQAGRTQEAAVQLERAGVRHAPDPSLHAALAWTLFCQGQLTEAAHECDVALSIQATDPHPYLLRGAIHLAAGNGAGAEADLTRFCALAPQDSITADVRLWIWIALREQGRPADADRQLSEAVVPGWSGASGDWEMKKGRFLLGHDSRTDLFAAAHSPDPETDRVQACEAWYFVGTKEFLDGDRAGAVRALRSCLATGRTQDFEFSFAREEINSIAASSPPGGKESTPPLQPAH